jgi:hypothetical protein
MTECPQDAYEKVIEDDGASSGHLWKGDKRQQCILKTLGKVMKGDRASLECP